MRIAITNPTDWPLVRRGAERFINELARYLATRGHDVTVISAHPGAKESIEREGYRVTHLRRLWRPWMARMGILEFHPFFVSTFLALVGRRFDVVQTLTFMDGLAAVAARRITRTPCAFLVNGLPPKTKYYRTISTGGFFFKRAMRGADEVIAISAYARHRLSELFGREGSLLPIPVDVERFQPRGPKSLDQPVIFCAAALDDTRKGGRLLARAFNLVKKSSPRAVLRLCGVSSKEKAEELLQLVEESYRGDVVFLPVAEGDSLPKWYAEAHVSVLPSIWEAFGMVVLESMASGTPVIGTRDGAIPELINDPSIGRLFDPGEIIGAEATNVEGFARAILEGIELSKHPETSARCRARANEFSWSTIGPHYEALYERLAGSKRDLRIRAEVSS